jgi:DNA-binding transcriptional ArsR family regulator
MVDAVDGGIADQPAAGPDLTLVGLLQAMSDPQRLAMLRVLADGEWHPCGAGDWATGLHKSTVSHHIRILREAGLFEGQQRGRNKYGRLRRAAVDDRFPGLLDGVLANI